MLEKKDSLKEMETSQPESIWIIDTTLRDGEQSPGFSMNLQEKLQMAEQLERLAAARDEGIVTLPRLATPRIGPDEVRLLADALVDQDGFEAAELEGRLPSSLASYLIGLGEWQILPGGVHDGFTVNVLRRRS